MLLLMAVVVSYFVLRINEAREPISFGEWESIEPQEWQEGQRLLYPDLQCTDKKARKEEVRRDRIRLGRLAKDHPLAEHALLVGYRNEMPVVLLPCDGTYWVFPEKRES